MKISGMLAFDIETEADWKQVEDLLKHLKMPQFFDKRALSKTRISIDGVWYTAGIAITRIAHNQNGPRFQPGMSIQIDFTGLTLPKGAKT